MNKKEISGEKIRKTMLEVIDEYSKQDPAYFQSGAILREVAERLDIGHFNGNILETQQTILTFWNDLFRTGHLAWGYDLSNINPPFCHITEKGRKALEHFSRDPVNPDGYLAYLKKSANIEKITLSYLEEALKTYNSNCFRASAVMIGVASESIVLKLRNVLVEKMQKLGKSIPKDLKDWKIKPIIDCIKKQIENCKSSIPKDTYNKFDNYWTPMVSQIRFIRNDAGHPKDINIIKEEDVHASLLIFPELVKMSNEIENWIKKSYK